MKQLLILLILGYRKFISPAFAPRCKYYPSCSTYAELSIREFGVRGVVMTLWRVIRCNPLSHGGVDYPSQSAITVIRERQMS
ncbi:MAG: membrane protein insertion efficiency factor YidD [Actinobacteria bacterium]|nr:membrane protein insertion efficiency factor YidD [Actinomycetota bacterium]NCA25595.1 membrane protein insertion efficiency factor YidD [Actinomycetota bacterium]NCU78495.1 membrane protein insertion efficiency factor YidD [Actinomycetota bacterium]